MTTTHSISVGAVLALALAGSAPVSARPIDLSSNGSYVQSPAAITRANVQAARTSAPVSAPPTIVRVSANPSGFDWGDAGIGAVAGIALSMLGLGGTSAVSQLRSRRTHSTALGG